MQSSNNPQTRIPNERDKVAAAVRALFEKATMSENDGAVDTDLTLFDTDELIKALTAYVMEQKNADYYRGLRLSDNVEALLEAFKQAAEAKLPEKNHMHNLKNNEWWYNKGRNETIEEATAALRSVSMEDIQGNSND